MPHASPKTLLFVPEPSFIVVVVVIDVVAVVVVVAYSPTVAATNILLL